MGVENATDGARPDHTGSDPAVDTDGSPERVVPETAVPEGETPAATCPYCDRPFPESALRDLHVGQRHPERCTGAERAAYEDARDAEDDTLFMYHLRVIGALGVTYAVLVLVYMIVLA
jgi:hypothetical protein